MILTDYIIMAVIGTIAVSDVALIWNGLPSYSSRIRTLGHRVAFFPYAWGALAGHYWSPAPPLLDQSEWVMVLVWLVGIGLLLSLVHYIIRAIGTYAHLEWLPLCVYFPLGVPVGAVCWSLAP